MTDDWSLKGKKGWIEVDNRQHPDFPWRRLEWMYFRTDIEKKDPKYHLYKASDIEMLRKKIIEDIESVYGRDDAELLKEIVNTRFGYEEEMK
ncbi:MAG: hypothetical protein J7L08_00855 [Candidatus Aenigmarchaeota archaeon]|nr:hypothetical protein [Candidatus Aenigmarchaeota archaeon]